MSGFACLMRDAEADLWEKTYARISPRGPSEGDAEFRARAEWFKSRVSGWVASATSWIEGGRSEAKLTEVPAAGLPEFVEFVRFALPVMRACSERGCTSCARSMLLHCAANMSVIADGTGDAKPDVAAYLAPRLLAAAQASTPREVATALGLNRRRGAPADHGAQGKRYRMAVAFKALVAKGWSATAAEEACVEIFHVSDGRTVRAAVQEFGAKVEANLGPDIDDALERLLRQFEQKAQRRLGG